ncbi:MAG: hypothetical protein AAF394_10805 [Planctomycetota bacterium]
MAELTTLVRLIAPLSSGGEESSLTGVASFASFNSAPLFCARARMLDAQLIFQIYELLNSGWLSDCRDAWEHRDWLSLDKHRTKYRRGTHVSAAAL